MTGPAGHASMGYAEAGDIGPDGRKAKRELSQSKRAAQNRAAQVRRLSVSLHCPLFPSLVHFESGVNPKNACEHSPFAGFRAFSPLQLVSQSSLGAIRVPRVGRRLIIAFASRGAGRPGRWQVHNTATGWSRPRGPDSNSRHPLLSCTPVFFFVIQLLRKLTSAIASIPPAQGGLHQETRARSEGFQRDGHDLQGGTGRE